MVMLGSRMGMKLRYNNTSPGQRLLFPEELEIWTVPSSDVVEILLAPPHIGHISFVNAFWVGMTMNEPAHELLQYQDVHPEALATGKVGLLERSHSQKNHSQAKQKATVKHQTQATELGKPESFASQSFFSGRLAAQPFFSNTPPSNMGRVHCAIPVLIANGTRTCKLFG
jgi:hypothetical protein